MIGKVGVRDGTGVDLGHSEFRVSSGYPDGDVR